MAEMEDLPREIQVALSYLDDIDDQIARIKANDNVLIRADMAKRVQQGDLALAYQELDRLATQGVNVSKARSHILFKEGNLYFAVAASGGLRTGDEKGWFKKAADTFERSVQLDESAEAFYNLGLCYYNLDRKTSAVQAFRKVEQLGDARLSIEATKEIRRLDPNGRIGNSLDVNPAAGVNVPGGAVKVMPGKRPNWKMVRNGVIALVIGIVLSGVIIGIPIALIGLGMIIYAFLVGLPT